MSSSPDSRNHFFNSTNYHIGPVQLYPVATAGRDLEASPDLARQPFMVGALLCAGVAGREYYDRDIAPSACCRDFGHHRSCAFRQSFQVLCQTFKAFRIAPMRLDHRPDLPWQLEDLANNSLG